MVKVTISPPGQPGHRVEYFLTKSRHRTFVPLSLIGALCFLLAASFLWATQPKTALVFVALAGGVIVMAMAVLRRGRQQSRELQRQPTSTTVNGRRPERSSNVRD